MSPRHTPWAETPADFAIGLGPIPEADWLEGGEADPAARKDALFANHRDLVWAEIDDYATPRPKCWPWSRPRQASARSAPTCRCSTQRHASSQTIWC